MPFHRHLTAALAVLCLLVASLPSRALDYPTGVVRLVIPYQPGGSAEAQARLLANELQKQWGKPVIIENKPGAGTTVGAAYVATQKPDGYTLYLASTSHTVTPSLYKSLPYDALKSFEQVSMVSVSPFQVLVKGDSEVKTLADLVALVKSKPGTMSWASSGVGAGPYLSGQLFMTKSGLDAVHVPFNGTPPSLNAVIGGHVNYVFADITALPLVRSGMRAPQSARGRTRSVTRGTPARGRICTGACIRCRTCSRPSWSTSPTWPTTWARNTTAGRPLP